MQVIYFLSPRAKEKYASESFLEFFNQNLPNNSKRLIQMLEMQNERFLGHETLSEIGRVGYESASITNENGSNFRVTLTAMLTGNYTNDAGYVLFKMTSEEYHLMNTKAERNELNKTDQEHYNNAFTVCTNKQFKFQITKISDAYFVNKIESIEISRSEEKVQQLKY